MNKEEAATVLALAGAFDRWIRVDDLTAGAWAYALKDVPAELAKTAVVEHYKGADAHKSLMPADIIRAVEREARLSRPLVVEDVRAAKARGLVSSSWPRDELLPVDVRERLFAARHADRLELGAAEVIAAHEFRDMDEQMGGAA